MGILKRCWGGGLISPPVSSELLHTTSQTATIPQNEDPLVRFERPHLSAVKSFWRTMVGRDIDASRRSYSRSAPAPAFTSQTTPLPPPQSSRQQHIPLHQQPHKLIPTLRHHPSTRPAQASPPRLNLRQPSFKGPPPGTRRVTDGSRVARPRLRPCACAAEARTCQARMVRRRMCCVADAGTVWRCENVGRECVDGSAKVGRGMGVRDDESSPLHVVEH